MEQPEFRPEHLEEREVECPSCGKKVKVTPFSFGNGYVATCPECKGVAYNNKEGK